MSLDEVLDLTRDRRSIHPRSLLSTCRSTRGSCDLHQTYPRTAAMDDQISLAAQTAADLLPAAVGSGAFRAGTAR
jgi:hypothetical protein